jgi:hypothetical protein
MLSFFSFFISTRLLSQGSFLLFSLFYCGVPGLVTGTRP